MSTTVATDTRSRMGIWLICLTGLSVLMSFALACVTPFAAFATFAALRLRRSEALILVSLVWCANQIVGFGFLHYPHQANTYLWGAALLAAALCAALTAAVIASRAFEINVFSRVAASLAGAMITYLAVVYLSGLALGGNEAAFRLPVLVNLSWTNAVTLASLWIVAGLAVAAGWAPPRLARSAAPAVS